MIKCCFKFILSQLINSRVKSSFVSSIFVKIPGKEYDWLVCVNPYSFPMSPILAIGMRFCNTQFGWYASTKGQEAEIICDLSAHRNIMECVFQRKRKCCFQKTGQAQKARPTKRADSIIPAASASCHLITFDFCVVPFGNLHYAIRQKQSLGLQLGHAKLVNLVSKLEFLLGHESIFLAPEAQPSRSIELGLWENISVSQPTDIIVPQELTLPGFLDSSKWRSFFSSGCGNATWVGPLVYPP